MKKLFLVFLVAILFFEVGFSQTAAVLLTNKKYFIQSAQNYGRNKSGIWDVSGGQMTKGKNMQIWTENGGCAQMFQFIESSIKGYYEIQPCDNSNVRVDIAGGKSDDGTNVQIWDKSNVDAQRFLFEHMGNGRFKIYTTKGKIINLKAENSNNGNNLQIWRNMDGIHNEWFLVDVKTREAYIPNKTQDLQVRGSVMPTTGRYQIQSAMSYGRNKNGYWDMKGEKPEKGSNIQIWTLGNNSLDQNFSFVRHGEFYQIQTTNENLVVDVAGAKSDKGTNIGVWQRNNQSSQDFYFKHLGNGRFKIYNKNGNIVNLKSQDNNNGNNVQTWSDHDGIHNEWYIIPVSGTKPYIPK